jgi:lysozyme
MLQISNKGLAFIAKQEAFVKVAFLDRTNWAIGFSHHGDVRHPVVSGMEWTIDQALKQMIDDCRVNGIVLGRAIKVSVSQPQIDALHTLAYNEGAGAISRSPLVRWLNEGDLARAADRFLDYEHFNRRSAEKRMFETGDYGDIGSMYVFDTDPHATPHPFPRTEPFPLPLEGFPT